MPPSALHDPRNADLVALLDAGSAFPSGAFAADAQVLLCRTINDLPQASSVWLLSLTWWSLLVSKKSCPQHEP